jgi:TRAP transporter TAXI family solute receptor
VERHILIATGGPGGAYYPLGVELANIYTELIPGIRASATATVASVFNVHAIQEQRADLGFSQGDVAYVAYKRGTPDDPRPHTRLRAMAVLYVNAVHILATRTSGIRRITDMAGRRVGVGSPGSGTEVAARIIIEGHGLAYADVQPAFLSFNEVATGMGAQSLDAGFIVSSYPVAALQGPEVAGVFRLVPVDRSAVNEIRAQYPFFKPITIPRHTYPGQSAEVETLGVDNLLLCRDDLDEELVYRLTRSLFETLPRLAKTHVSAEMIDVEIGPATPIPLHAGAARYYRERELLQ